MPTLTYNIPAPALADFLDALRHEYRLPNATQAELQALVESKFKQNLIAIYRGYMRDKDYTIGLD